MDCVSELLGHYCLVGRLGGPPKRGRQRGGRLLRIPCSGFLAVMKPGFVLVTCRNLNEMLQAGHDFAQERAEGTDLGPGLVERDGLLFLCH